ncbi:MAG: IPT/TIG domain-containing protein [Cystobacter sp.]
MATRTLKASAAPPPEEGEGVAVADDAAEPKAAPPPKKRLWVFKKNVAEANNKQGLVRLPEPTAGTLVSGGKAIYWHNGLQKLPRREGTSSSGYHPPVPPTLASLAPATVAAGSAETIFSCNGDGFYSGSVVMFGVEALASSYVSAQQVRGTIPANLLTGAKTVQVTVSNGPGLVSAPKPFTISAAGPASAPAEE